MAEFSFTTCLPSLAKLRDIGITRQTLAFRISIENWHEHWGIRRHLGTEPIAGDEAEQRETPDLPVSLVGQKEEGLFPHDRPAQ